MDTYLEARKDLTERYIHNLKNLSKYKQLITAFEESPLFELERAGDSTMRVVPVGKPSGKELSIMLDEVLFDLPFIPVRENLDESDLNITFGEYPESYTLWVTIKAYTKCKIIELSSKARIWTNYDKTFAIVCEGEEATNV